MSKAVDGAMKRFHQRLAEIDLQTAGQKCPPRWRVGGKVPLNVYEGDQPVCQCHTPSDARRIVYAMNAQRSIIIDERKARKAVSE